MSSEGALSAEAFDEQQYLRANPDVAQAVRAGAVASAWEHYSLWGDQEGRDLGFSDNGPRDRLILTGSPAATQANLSSVHYSAEAVIVSRGGGVLIAGWIDDVARPLNAICVIASGWRVTFDGAGLARRTRPDVAEALGRPAAYAFGYLGFVFGDPSVAGAGQCELQFRFGDGGVMAAVLEIQVVEDSELRSTLLSHLAGASHLPGETTNPIACLARGMGDHIVRFNHSITAPMVRQPYVERFAGASRAYRGAIVVCIYGRPEYHFIQNALFSMNEGIGDYEFIFVSNSPELADTLLGNARNAFRTYGLDQTLVLLPGNAGFGAANNAATQSARSDRILFVNPDVLPKDNGWARKHTDLIDSAPQRQTDIFGAPLYYDDGSLMHGGMYFEMDTRVSFHDNRTALSQLLRVEHYGKGAPARSPEFTRPRPAPAVTGAFISASRPWFEKLGGFTEDYVFGHYEDADLCLKSLAAGTAPWLHDLRLWHLEGKGSTRLPVHEGGSLVNRWLFSTRWGEMVSENLLGPEPTHPLLVGEGALSLTTEATGNMAGPATPLRAGTTVLERAPAADSPTDPTAYEFFWQPTVNDQDIQALLMRFESLGENCELGFVQRHFETEPLDLLRWTAMKPKIMIRLLKSKFSDLGNIENMKLYRDPWREYFVKDEKYDMPFHTFQYDDVASEQTFLEKHCARIRWLCKKLLADLRSQRKIFVYKDHEGNGDGFIGNVNRAIQSYGPNTLLWISTATAEKSAGAVERVKPGLLRGYLSHSNPGEDQVWDIPYHEWLSICRNALAITDGAAL